MKRKIIYIGILILTSGCNNTSKETTFTESINEIKIEKDTANDNVENSLVYNSNEAIFPPL